MNHNYSKENDQLFAFILNKLSDLYPNTSKELTKKVKIHKGLSKYERKELKILMLYREKEAIFDEITSMLNREFTDSYDNPYAGTAIDISENIYGVMRVVSGSYSSKYVVSLCMIASFILFWLSW